MDIEFISGLAAIVDDESWARDFFAGALQLPLEGDDYLSSEAIAGVRHFGVWPLRLAAQSCFGIEEWPADVPRPQATIEFELTSPAAVDQAVAELEAGGYRLVHAARTEPWGQTVARLQTPEGLLIGLSFAPWHHGSAFE